MIAAAQATNGDVFEHAPVPMFLTSPDGRVFDANPAACQAFGYSRDELLELGRAALVDPSDPRLGPALEERRQKGHFSGPLRLLRKDGTRLETELASTVFTDDQQRERTSMVVQIFGEAPGNAIVHVCSYCLRVHLETDDWQALTAYVSKRLGYRFSHGVCPACYDKYVAPELD